MQMCAESENHHFSHIFFQHCSVYEKLFETSDIVSDVFKLCAGHFHILPDISLSHIFNNDNGASLNKIVSCGLCGVCLSVPLGQKSGHIQSEPSDSF